MLDTTNLRSEKPDQKLTQMSDQIPTLHYIPSHAMDCIATLNSHSPTPYFKERTITIAITIITLYFPPFFHLFIALF